MENALITNKVTKIPFIIDTDMSPDSWVAVLFAALHPNADLLAISVSGTGEAHGTHWGTQCPAPAGSRRKSQRACGFRPNPIR